MTKVEGSVEDVRGCFLVRLISEKACFGMLPGAYWRRMGGGVASLGGRLADVFSAAADDCLIGRVAVV